MSTTKWAVRPQPDSCTARVLRVLPSLALALLATATLASTAAAQAPEDSWEDKYYPYSRDGVYVGIGALFALENFDRDNAVHGTGTGQNVDGENAGGPQIRFGYRYNQRIGGEVLFQHYSGFNLKANDKATGTKIFDDDFTGWTMTLNGKLYGLLGRIQPYGLFGMGGIVFDDKKGDDAGFVARLGGGIDFYLTDNVVFDFEAAYVLPAGSIDDLQFATFGFGIQYRY